MTVAWAIIGFYTVVLLRAGGTYLLGRLTASGARRLRLERRIGRHRTAKAERLVDRYGPFAVIGSFFTIGLQTGANFTAGLPRMPLPGSLPALAVGGLGWAVVYGTLGALTIDGVVALTRTQPVLAGAVAALIVLTAAGLTSRAVKGRADTRRHLASDPAPPPA